MLEILAQVADPSAPDCLDGGCTPSQWAAYLSPVAVTVVGYFARRYLPAPARRALEKVAQWVTLGLKKPGK